MARLQQASREVITKRTNTMNDTKHHTPKDLIHEALSAVEYAAIQTGQPCSGTPWLDEMIRSQRRERLAGQALAGLYVGYADHRLSIKECSQLALDAADDLIIELEGGAK